MRIFVINPGSTSTKIAVYEDEKPVWMTGAHHPVGELAQFHHISEQYEYRKDFILKRLDEAGITREFDAVIGHATVICALINSQCLSHIPRRYPFCRHFSLYCLCVN